MIIVQDRIEVAAANLPRLRQLFTERYLPAARERGLVLVDSGLSPPLALTRQTNVFWLRWQLADVGAFWKARAMAGFDPSVAGFWAEVDSFCPARRRDFLRPDAWTDAPLPAAQSLTPFLTRPTGWRETAQLHLRPGIDAGARSALETALASVARLPGVQAVHLGANLVVGYGAGDYSWDVRYEDAAAAAAARTSAHWTDTLAPLLEAHVACFDGLALDTVGAGCRDRGLSAGIKRTGLFRLLPGVSDAQRTAFEQDLLDMPAYIPEIINWRLSRALPLARGASANAEWSYVWEQEYAQLDDLNVAYMVHPHHWAWVDGCFDPESGRQLVDVRLCHAYCALQASVLGAESLPL